jgi:hypothetical protein
MSLYGPKDPALNTDGIAEPILSAAVYIMLATVFTVYTMISVYNSYYKGYSWKNVVKTVGVMAAIALPLAGVSQYAVYMSQTPYTFITLPDDFCNIIVLTLGLAWVVFVSIATTFPKTATFKEKKFAIYAITMCTIYVIPLVEAFTAGSWDAGLQQTIPPAISFACLLVGFIQFLTSMVSMYQHAGSKGKKSMGQKVIEGRGNTDVYAYSYVWMTDKYQSDFEIIGVDIGVGEIIARVVSLPFLYLCKYNDAIKFMYSGMAIPGMAAMISSILGQQFYLPLEGMLAFWTYGLNYWGASIVATGLGSNPNIVGPNFLRYNLLQVSPSVAYQRIELYQSAPGFFVIWAILAIAAQSFGFFLTSMRDELLQERTFSSTRLKSTNQ